MSLDIVTNVGNQKKPWDDIPIGVLIELERLKEEARREKERPRLYAPLPSPPKSDSTEQEESEDEVVIRF